MLIDFNTLPNHARIWIYQSERAMQNNEIENISDFLIPKISNWASHGNALQGAFKFLNEQMLVIGVDTDFNLPSGCSIDCSTQWLKEIQMLFNIDFFSRSQCIIKNNIIVPISIFDLKKYVISGDITPETIIFNNQIQLKSDLENNWQIEAKKSYLQKYFTSVNNKNSMLA